MQAAAEAKFRTFIVLSKKLCSRDFLFSRGSGGWHSPRPFWKPDLADMADEREK
jgi:hypothetical protein